MPPTNPPLPATTLVAGPPAIGPPAIAPRDKDSPLHPRGKLVSDQDSVAGAHLVSPWEPDINRVDWRFRGGGSGSHVGQYALFGDDKDGGGSP